MQSLATKQYESALLLCHLAQNNNRLRRYYRAMLKLLTSVHLGKIDDLHKNGKSYNIFNYFFMEKHEILPQFDDLTSQIWIFYIDFTKLQIWCILANF